MELEFKGDGVEEHGVEKATGKTLLRVHPEILSSGRGRATSGQPGQFKEKLKWDPRQASLQALVEEMVDADIARVQNPNIHY